MLGILKTEFEFRLPRGYIDAAGDLHTDGVMRLATAGDELLPLKDPRVRQNPAYLRSFYCLASLRALGRST